MSYNKHYLTKNLFGDPLSGLIEFFSEYPDKGNVLDLGCGQGRNTLALARLGYQVTGIDSSTVGIKQMMEIAHREQLNVIGKVNDIFKFKEFVKYDFILLDSMFHFERRDRKRETGLIKTIVSGMRQGSYLVVCIADSGNKVNTLNEAIDFELPLQRTKDEPQTYIYQDKDSGHQSISDYRLIIARK